jgi:hypothetical protein
VKFEDRSMTEVEWASSRDAWAMLQHMSSRYGERKLRLFAVGCCRQIWDSIVPLRCRRAVETSERFADGEATMAELLHARNLAFQSVTNSERIGIRHKTFDLNYDHRLRFAAETVRPSSDDSVHGLGRLRLIPELVRLAPGLLRCVFGPDPDRAVTFEPEWLNSTLISLARTIYEDREFDLMPILGDALEEAGCGNEEILRHCRDGGRHVRGCWVVDLILGKS